MARLPRSGSSCLLLSAAVLVIVFGWRASGPMLAQGSARTRSTRDGVYSEAQAERGRAVFDEKCIDCHNAAMWGSDWDAKTVGDVFDYVSQYMPEPAPGSLSPQQARDVVGFILKANALPTGAADLPETLDGLKQITLQKQEK